MCRYHLGACIFKSEGNYLLNVLLLENRRNSVRYSYKHSILYADPTLEKRVSHGQRMSIMIRVRFRLSFYSAGLVIYDSLPRRIASLLLSQTGVPLLDKITP